MSQSDSVVVPVEPTEEMLAAGSARIGRPRYTTARLVAHDAYKAMVSASPPQEAADRRECGDGRRNAGRDTRVPAH